MIGTDSPTTISRLEQLKRLPSSTVAFACLVVFDTTALDIFPGLFHEIKREVLERARELYEELQGDNSVATRVKLDFLESVLARIDRASDKSV